MCNNFIMAHTGEELSNSNKQLYKTGGFVPIHKKLHINKRQPSTGTRYGFLSITDIVNNTGKITQ